MNMKVSIKERVLLVMAGWAQQFDNPPDWLPDISTKDGVLHVGGKPVCQVAEIRAVSCDVEALFLDTTDARYTVVIDWPFEGQPSFGEVKHEPFPKSNYMGFDDFIYIVRATDEDGETFDYEYGCLLHALEHFEKEGKAIIVKVKDDTEYPTEYKKG